MTDGLTLHSLVGRIRSASNVEFNLYPNGVSLADDWLLSVMYAPQHDLSTRQRHLNPLATIAIFFVARLNNYCVYGAWNFYAV